MRLSLALALAMLTATTPALAEPGFAEVNNARFLERVSLSDAALELKGTGLGRFAWVIKVCAAALYGPPEVPVEELPLSDVSKRLEIEYFVAVSRENFVEAAMRALIKQQSREDLAAMSRALDKLHALYSDVQAGDRYALSYTPGQGLILELNGEEVGRVREGAEFAQAYFGIWLGDKPISNSLRRGLLGG
ncbi:MAG: chalcone isomerase family protein [Acidobacteriota bacterium]|nr:MAG: chalcone isomerase family protein [Acidobacteriota bacterium]